MAGTEVDIGEVPPAATALEVLNTQIGGMIVLSPDHELLHTVVGGQLVYSAPATATA